jgi:hypothetical protein
MGLSGSALEDKKLSWNVQQGYNSKGSDAMGSASANYKGAMGSISWATAIPVITASFPLARWADWWFIHTASPRLSLLARPGAGESG